MRHPFTQSVYRSFQRACCLGLTVWLTTLGVGVVSTIVQPEMAQAVVDSPTAIQQAINRLKRSQQRWIEVNRTTQRVIAWEGNRWINAMIVSTGKPSTPTVTGVFNIYAKYPQARMQGADYDIADVPHVMYFYGGYGFHGAYWHHRFGTPVSHGCVNLSPDKAKWLFNFASVGTPVVVRD